MKKIFAIVIAMALLLSLVPASFAMAKSSAEQDGVYQGNGFPSGPHYELGLIGRPNNYTGNGVDNSNRHNIMIPLDTSGYVDGKVKLFMTQGDDWLVVDGDATVDGTAELQIAPGYYAVFVRALGAPDKSLDIDAWFTYWMDYPTNTNKSLAVYMGGVDLTREAGKPQTKEVSKLFYYTGTTVVNGVQNNYTNEWIFDIDELAEYWWDLDNDGLKRLEVRFYPVDQGYVPPALD